MRRLLVVARYSWMIALCALGVFVMGVQGPVSGSTSTHQSLPRSRPEAQGISSAALLGFVEAAEQHLDALHSFMLLRHGQVVAAGWWSPYGPEHPHELFSLSKSFTSTAVGLAVAEGLLSVDDPVLSFFPEEAPAEPSANLKSMRVRDLLSMNTGHQEDTMGRLFEREGNTWTSTFLSLPVEHKPGTHFVYNTGATYMLSAILQKATGTTVLEYLGSRLFVPLGIAHPTWGTSPQGITLGGFGLSIKTEDIARFGQLYLQKGLWNGQRLLPEAWVAAATARQTSNGSDPNSDWEQGYGYQFWRCRHGVYRGDGAFGQYCIVLPDQDAVLAITSGVKDVQAVLNLVWEHLLPALQPGPMPADDQVQARLQRKLASLSLPPQQGQPSSSLAAHISGKTFIFPANDQKVEAISLDFGKEGCVVTVRDSHGEHRIAGGSGAWLKGTTTLDSDSPQLVAASGAWTAEDTYVMRLCFYETPFCPKLTFRFTQDQLLFDFEANVAFGPTQRPQLVGHLQ